jgi:hypothetical protein
MILLPTKINFYTRRRLRMRETKFKHQRGKIREKYSRLSLGNPLRKINIREIY